MAAALPLARAFTFRELPKHVLETICSYVMGGNPSTSGPDPDGHQSCNRPDLMYSLCPEWTQVALEHCFCSIDVALDVVESGFCTSHLYAKMGIHMNKLCHIAKTVNFTMSLYDVVSGRAAQALEQSPVSSLAFEAVRRVQINFDWKSDMASIPTLYDANTVPSLYKKLVPMFPNIRTVQVTKERMYYYRPVVANCPFSQCVADLHDHYLDAAVSLTWNLRATNGFTNTSSRVTKIDFNCISNKPHMVDLVRRCADTLEHLKLAHYKYQSNNNVFEETKGKAVAYHRLKFLILLNFTNMSGPKCSRESPAFMLPRLTNLILLGGYPFKDGALFKSVSKTLTSVRLSTTMSLLDTINRHSIFSDICCPNVKHISMFSTWDRFYVERYNAYFLFLSIVSRRLTSLKVTNAYITDIFMDLVMQAPALDTIQSLNIGGTALSFNSLCSLIESLPRMEQLRFQSIEVYEDYDIPDAIGLYEQIIERRSELSASLKFCQVIDHDPLDTTNDLAICGILLSVLCPRFTRLVVSSTARSRYDSFIRKAIQQEPFSRYSERLSRLMFNDTVEPGEPSK